MRDTWISTAKLTPPEPPPGWLRRALPVAAPVAALAAGPG
ncbi:MAG: hypothetical protein JWM80_4050, partial [Cyanobacteria bacterium RYN_339]|nr:hypothetical protein [Cyanobacteria bacterium RYN_339]